MERVEGGNVSTLQTGKWMIPTDCDTVQYAYNVISRPITTNATKEIH